MQADAPERGGADLIGGIVVFRDGEISPIDLVHVLTVVLQHGRDDAVACADIVKEEVAVRVKLLFRERGRDGEGAAVNFRAGGGGGAWGGVGGGGGGGRGGGGAGRGGGGVWGGGAARGGGLVGFL